MNKRSDGQVFFIFDAEFCQNEEDDPKDAILYFYPPETKAVARYTLCCHLMGVSQFLKFSFSPVALIRLKRGTFAVNSIGRYFLALKDAADLPDTVLQWRLSYLLQMFRFYYNGFDTIQTTCSTRQEFLEKMASVWNRLLSVFVCVDNTLESIFDTVPIIELPKTAGILHLQAAEALRACQCFGGVTAGCIMCCKSVLYSQLPTRVLHNLLCVSCQSNEVMFGESVSVKFGIPGGVNLTYVYLTDDELAEVAATASSNFVQPASRCAVNVSAVPAAESSSEETRQCEVFNGECQLTLFHVDRGDDESRKETSAASTVFFTPPKAAHIFDGDLIFSYATGKTDSTELKVVGGGLVKPSLILCEVEKEDKSQVEVVAALKSSPDRCAISILNELKQPVKSLDVADDVTEVNSTGEDLKASPSCLQKLILYSHTFDDATLLLLLDSCAEASANLINSLWELGIATMKDLRKDVRRCLETSANSKDLGNTGECSYLQYDKKWQSVKGTMLNSKEDFKSDHFMRHSVWLIHDDFQSDKTSHEITIYSQNSGMYGNQLGAKETYYHHHSLGANDAKKCFPRQNDTLAQISKIAKEKLEKEQNIIIF